MQEEIKEVAENQGKDEVLRLQTIKEKRTKQRQLFYYTPIVITVLLFVLSFWLGIRAISNYLFLMVGQFLDFIPAFVLFGDPLKPTMFGMLTISIVNIAGWLISTKVPQFQSIRWRVFSFFQMFIGILFYFAWFSTAPFYNKVLPYLMERVAQVEVANIWHQVLIGNPENLLVFIVFFPTIVLILVCVWLGSQYALHHEAIRERFEEFEFVSYRLQTIIDRGKKEKWPDVVLGPNSKTKELVIQPGKDRTLNNIIVGSIGTGKTAALVLPILNQDLHWMTRFINDFPELYERNDYHSEDVKGMYLNGISVIEPSNDLCKKAYQLVEAHGIPKSAVFYIDPTNPDTPNINPMQGPVDQVAEAFAMVMEGLAEAGESNFFFQQSERNHLKHYIYLLKQHEPNKEVTFDELLDMYNNAQVVREMHVKLKATIPDNIDSIQDGDERNHWKIVQQVDEWFDLSLLPKLSRNGTPERIKEGKYYNQPAYYDAKAEYVQGLRNILNDIGANKLLRRVLFGKSDFNFDKHLEYGGVLLVNTAKGEMGTLSNVLGKIVLLSLQNAVFRREPGISNFHHILVDEFPDYIYRPFKEFPAQSRKYKAIVTVVSQTVTQLSDKYGETYMQTLLGTLRHKMVYGDIPEFDAQLFSGIFGDKKQYTESQNEQSVSPLQEQPMLRAGSMYTEEQLVNLTPHDLIYQKAFQAAVKIVNNNTPIPAVQIDANFVPKKEFKKAIEVIDEEAGEIWLYERDKHLNPSSLSLIPENALVEEEEPIIENSIDDTPPLSSDEQPNEPNKVITTSENSRIRTRTEEVALKKEQEIPTSQQPKRDELMESLKQEEDDNSSITPIVESEPNKDAETLGMEALQSVMSDSPPTNHSTQADVSEIGEREHQLLNELTQTVRPVTQTTQRVQRTNKPQNRQRDRNRNLFQQD